MIIITISEEKLRNSKYYDGIKCWDYPIEEIDYLIELEHEENNEVKVYAMTENKRLYELNCSVEDIKNI